MKRTIAVLMVLIVSLFAVVGVFAQDDTTPEATPEATEESTTRPDRQRGGRGGAIFDIVTETLGVEEADLRSALQEDGATWTSVIESLGGDVDEIQALIVAHITENLEAELADVEARVTDLLTNPRPQRGVRPDGSHGNNGNVGPRDDRRGGRGGRGHGGAQDDAPATEDEAGFGEAPANS
ncbi:MAG: hypothetical protein RLP44_19045 [Aggregatilineales bacterium]